MTPKNLQPNTFLASNPVLGGTSVPINQQSVSAGPSFTVSPGTTQTGTFPVNPTVGGFGVFLQASTRGGSATATNVTVSGVTTFALYVLNTGAIIANPAATVYGAFPNGQIETSVTVSVTASALNAAAMTVNLQLIPPGLITVSEIINTPANPVQVTAIGPLLTVQPLNNISLAAAGIQHIITGTSVMTIHLVSMHIEVVGPGNAIANWQDTAGTPVDVGHMNLTNGNPRDPNYVDTPLTIGQGLDLNVTTALAACSIYGFITYFLA